MDGMEDDALNSILGDLDGVEGREVCQACGKPMDEAKPDEDHKIEEPEVKGGMKITIEPMDAMKAKEELSKATNADMDDDKGMPLML